MTLEEASHQFKIPLEDLKALRVEGLLSEPLHPQEVNNLSFLSYIWDKSVWIKRQLRRRNKKARRALVETADLSKIESYIFSRYFNARKRLFVNQVANEVQVYYGVPLTKKLIRTIYRIRRKATDARYYEKKKQGDSRNPDDFENPPII